MKKGKNSHRGTEYTENNNINKIPCVVCASVAKKRRSKMKLLKTLTILLLVAVVTLTAQDMKSIKKEFKGIQDLEIELTSGDCEIKAGKSGKVLVEVKYDVKPEKNFTPEFVEKGKTLKLSEEWRGRNTRAKVLWSITAPENTEIEFSAASGDLSIKNMNTSIESSTASGDVSISNCKGEFEIEAASGDIEAKNLVGDIEISTASGDIEVDDCKGDIELSAASGDIEAKNLEGSFDMSVASGDVEVDDCKGEFDLSAASGDVDATRIILDEASSFSAASGEVTVILGASPKYDIEVSVASGDATLDFNGNKVVGTIEMTANKKRGKISAPFKCDNIEEFEEHNTTYVKKTYRKGDKPLIIIETSSGEATLKK